MQREEAAHMAPAEEQGAWQEKAQALEPDCSVHIPITPPPAQEVERPRARLLSILGLLTGGNTVHPTVKRGGELNAWHTSGPPFVAATFQGVASWAGIRKAQLGHLGLILLSVWEGTGDSEKASFPHCGAHRSHFPVTTAGSEWPRSRVTPEAARKSLDIWPVPPHHPLHGAVPGSAGW